MAKLHSTLRRAGSARRGEIDAKLLILASYNALTYQAYENLRAECRLPEVAWRDFITSLLSVGDHPSDIHQCVRDFCRRWILNGDPVEGARHIVMGRAVTVGSLVAIMRKLNPGRAKAKVWREVRDLWAKPFPLVKMRWADRPLGMHLMWSTFDLEKRRPFTDLPKSADGMRQALGLDPRLRGRAILLLEYNLDPTIEPRFPTIADAYAGDEWPYFFRPAPETAPHGLTLSWPECADHTKPRPEVVHKVVNGIHLRYKPQRLS